LIAITSPDNFYVLKFNRKVFQDHLESGKEIGEDGIRDAFEFLFDIPEMYLFS
jgi:hypothetical protein